MLNKVHTKADENYYYESTKQIKSLNTLTTNMEYRQNTSQYLI